jgi:hypothetical protein
MKYKLATPVLPLSTQLGALQISLPYAQNAQRLLELTQQCTQTSAHSHNMSSQEHVSTLYIIPYRVKSS